jgi:hypothetical protein
VGLLINFNVPVLRRGIKRIVNHFDESSERGRGGSNAEAQETSQKQTRTSEELFSAPLRLRGEG